MLQKTGCLSPSIDKTMLKGVDQRVDLATALVCTTVHSRYIAVEILEITQIRRSIACP